jgi:hypothetical protein
MIPVGIYGEGLGLKFVELIAPAQEATLQNTMSSQTQFGTKCKTKLVGTTTKYNHAQHEYPVHFFQGVLLLAI